MVLVTASPEGRQAVAEEFARATGQAARECSEEDFVYLDLGAVHRSRVALVGTGPGSFTRGGSQQSVQRAIEALTPVAVILVGSARGSDPEKQARGDVLIPEKLCVDPGWSKGLAATGEPKVRTSGLLFVRMGLAAMSWTGAPLHFGTLLSCEHPAAASAVPDVIGIESGALGVFAACAKKSIDWIAVLGISGFADADNDEATAASHGAAFALHSLQMHAPAAPANQARKRRA